MCLVVGLGCAAALGAGGWVLGTKVNRCKGMMRCAGGLLGSVWAAAPVPRLPSRPPNCHPAACPKLPATPPRAPTQVAARLVEPVQSHLQALVKHRKYKGLGWEEAKVGRAGLCVCVCVYQRSGVLFFWCGNWATGCPAWSAGVEGRGRVPMGGPSSKSQPATAAAGTRASMQPALLWP